MLIKEQTDRLILKVDELKNIYEPYVFNAKQEMDVYFYETAKYLSSPPKKYERKIKRGQKWGNEGRCGWFHFEIITSKEEKLFLYSESGATEHLIFVNGQPAGMLDYVKDAATPEFRGHKYFPLPCDSKVVVDLEGYASHISQGCFPLDKAATFALKTCQSRRTFDGIYVGYIRQPVALFIRNLHYLNSAYQNPFITEEQKDKLRSLYVKIFEKAYRSPKDCGIDVAVNALNECNEICKEYFKPAVKKEDYPLVSIVGHSHMDTAWLWDTDETKRKLARTCANALMQMDTFPDYTFIQSSALHLEWMKELYPQMFERIKERVKEGRYEPNGGSYVECDANLTGGESMIRQFIFGQKFLRDNFNYQADTYWLPDTFGYSAALPQILNGCNIKYFMTTKLYANDTNRFPYDTFLWEGIDGSKVLVQFNNIHCYIDPSSVNHRLNFIKNYNNVPMTLISYGFGDGGGGPFYDMIALADITKEGEYTCKIKHNTVSKHMQEVEKIAKDLPVHKGELYFEAHRGTYTSMSEIKKYNRYCEIALRNAEMLSVITGREKEFKTKIDEIYKIVLLNQFHDILPGTCIKRANDSTFKRYAKVNKELPALIEKIITSETKSNFCLTAVNTLNWDRKCDIDLEFNNLVPKEYDFDVYEDFNGNKKMVIFNVDIKAFSSKQIELTKKNHEEKSAFNFNGNVFETPFYNVKFGSAMEITSLYSKKLNKELVRDKGGINYFTWGEDMPLMYDNWDIDADYRLKQKKELRLLSSTVIANGNHFRLRNVFNVAYRSKIVQDIVFYKDKPEIEFETKLDWHDKHQLLKTNFDINIISDSFYSEIQFGNVKRCLNSGTKQEAARFEVCNHKWSAIEDDKNGVALINDCKYGIGFLNDTLSLTLIKSGTHPDETGDEGMHIFKYALRPYVKTSLTKEIVRPAYEFNISPLLFQSAINLPNFNVDIANENIILETAKCSEDKKDVILRFYECEGKSTDMELSFKNAADIVEVNLLEEPIIKNAQKYKNDNGLCYKRIIRPFEIVTLRVKK